MLSLLVNGGQPAQAAEIEIDTVEPASQQEVWTQLAALQFPTDAVIPFRETRQTRMLRVPKVQSGHLWIDKDGDFVMQVQSPKSEERRLSDKRLSLKRNGKSRSTRLDPARGAHQLLLAVVDILQGNSARLQNNFNVLETRQGGTAFEVTSNWTWTLTPKDESMRRELTQLLISGTATSLTSLRAERGRSWQEIQILLPKPQS